MKASVRAAFVHFTTKFEGSVAWMYLDIKGLVTVAIGNLIDPMSTAVGLPFVHKGTGTLATAKEIRDEWALVKGTKSLMRLGHRAAEGITRLRLTPAGIASIVDVKLAQNEAYLVRRWPAFATWPADAQLGLLSMAWAMGPAFVYPKFEAACKVLDFAHYAVDEDGMRCLAGGAALECYIPDQKNPGLVPRNTANKRLFENAQMVLDASLDPEKLYWPGQPLPTA